MLEASRVPASIASGCVYDLNTDEFLAGPRGLWPAPKYLYLKQNKQNDDAQSGGCVRCR